MSKRFTDKVVLVTGGGSGIGRATAQAFAREDATVVVAGRDADKLEQTVKLITVDGGAASAVVADITRSDDVAALVHATVERHGGLHIAFNNAGTAGRPGPLADLDEEVWDTVVATNLTGLFLCMKYEIAHMREHGGGVIVNMASNIGAHGRRPGMGAYAAAKAGASVLTRNAAREYIADNIRINAVSPGATDTAMSRRPGETDADRDQRIASLVPLGRVGATEEVAAAVLWLAGSESAFVVGHDLVSDGGATA
ncbi:glucose 1-dehydrogenase [Micromonospora sp. SCSIO 07396]